LKGFAEVETDRPSVLAKEPQYGERNPARWARFLAFRLDGDRFPRIAQRARITVESVSKRPAL
jgi:hypothetical protein